ncbi:MAG: COG1470 family protein, partial [Gemmatimonadota bacterium]
MWRFPQRLSTSTAVLALALAAAGCAGGDDGPTGNNFSIQISVNPASLTLQQGTSGTVQLTLTRGGGFSADVTASVSGLPTGVTVSVSPANLTGSTTTAVVTVTVASSVALGTYTATVTGTASGVGSATTTYQLTVTAPPDFSLTAPALTVQAGTSGNATININRTNLPGAVALTLVNPPSGITGTFNPASATGATSVLTVAVDAAVLAGSHTLTIRGSATGPGEKTTTLALTVTGAANYTLTAAPNPVPVVRGQSRDVTITITRTNFTGAVNLSLPNPPAGISGVFAPASPTGNTSTLTITVNQTVVAGNYTLTVMGTASGVPTLVDESAAQVAPGDRLLSIQVQATDPVGVALSPAQPLVMINQGGTGQVGINIMRTNFANSLNLAAAAQQGGITVGMNPAATTGNSSTANITVGSSVPPGTYPVTVTGTGTGLTTPAQTMFNVQVVQNTGRAAEYVFCDASSFPIWFAFRDGSGQWTEVQPTTAAGIRKYTFNATQPQVEVAYAIRNQNALRDPARLAQEQSRFDMMTRSARRGNRVLLPAPVPSARPSWLSGQDDYVTTHNQLDATELPPPGLLFCPPPENLVDFFLFAFLGLISPDIAQTGSTATSPVTTVPPATSSMVNVRAGVHDVLSVLGTTSQAFRATWVRDVSVAVAASGVFGRQVTVPVTIDRNASPGVSIQSVSIVNKPVGMNVLTLHWFGTNRGIIGPFLNHPASNAPTTQLFRPATSASGDYYGYTFTGSEVLGMEVDSRMLTRYVSTFASGVNSLPSAVPSYTVTQNAGVFGATGSVPSEFGGSSRSALFLGTIATAAAGNSYIQLQSPGWIARTGATATHNFITTNFPGGNYPAAAVLTAPLVNVSVSMGTAAGATTPGSTHQFSSRSRLF